MGTCGWVCEESFVGHFSPQPSVAPHIVVHVQHQYPSQASHYCLAKWQEVGNNLQRSNCEESRRMLLLNYLDSSKKKPKLVRVVIVFQMPGVGVIAFKYNFTWMPEWAKLQPVMALQPKPAVLLPSAAALHCCPALVQTGSGPMPKILCAVSTTHSSQRRRK